MDIDEKPTQRRFLAASRWKRPLQQLSMGRHFAAAVGVMLCSAAAEAKVIFVNQAVAASGTGSSWSSAFKDLQEGLQNSVAGDLVYIAKGTYYPTKIGLAGGDNIETFKLKGVKLYGGFAGGETGLADRDPVVNVTTLSGEIWPVTPTTLGHEVYWSTHVVVLSANSSLDGLTVTKGRAIADELTSGNVGGGILVPTGMTVTLNNCIITECFASLSGAGVSGDVTATNCVFSKNLVNNRNLYTATAPSVLENWLNNPRVNGGAISGGVIKAINCNFIENALVVKSLDLGQSSAAAGGAISANAVVVENCTFDGNLSSALASSFASADANSRGGAINVRDSLTATRCRFINNIARAESDANYTADRTKAVGFIAEAVVHGGAIAGPVNAANCVFSNNLASSEVPAFSGDQFIQDALGGAAYTEKSSDLTGCLFVQNKAVRSFKSTTSNLFSPSNSAIGGGVFVATGQAIIMNSTLFDNVTLFTAGTFPSNLSGGALGCFGNINILSNIIWDTTPQTTLIYVSGRSRISNRLYPTPSTETINIMTGSLAAVKSAAGANVNFGQPATRTLPDVDPQFVAISNPIGPDNVWGTADDGLRLQPTSPALGMTNLLFAPKDPYDLDKDLVFTETMPVDIAGFRRIQNGTMELGAYEVGSTLNSPDISIEQPVGNVLVDGAATVNFGSAAGTTRTFILKNVGAGDLYDIVLTGDGPNIGQFSFTQPAATDLAGGGSTSFSVTFNPNISGPLTAALHLVSNDPDESPFDIALTGNVQLPDIDLEFPVGNNLVDAVATIDYGLVGAQSVAVKTFTIRNSGVAELNIASIVSSGANAANFVISGPLLTSLPPGATTTFSVTFTPVGPGERLAYISIVSNDPDTESTFLLNLIGMGATSPEIAISQPFAADLVDNGSLAFGSVKTGSLLSKKLIIRNIGSAPLNGLGVSISGSKNFKVTSLAADSLAAGGTISFKVTFKPSSLGRKTAKLIVTNNDADESPFELDLSGTGMAPKAKKKKKSMPTLVVTRSFSAGASAVSGAGVVSMASGPEGFKYQILTVRKPTDGSLDAASAEVSSNLIDWYSGAKHTTTLVDSAALLQVRDDTPVEAGKKRYIRLK